jgi:hypothetical protein
MTVSRDGGDSQLEGCGEHESKRNTSSLRDAIRRGPLAFTPTSGRAVTAPPLPSKGPTWRSRLARTRARAGWLEPGVEAGTVPPDDWIDPMPDVTTHSNGVPQPDLGIGPIGSSYVLLVQSEPPTQANSATSPITNPSAARRLCRPPVRSDPKPPNRLRGPTAGRSTALTPAPG